MATNTQKEFRKQMKVLAKEGKVSKSSMRRTVRFVEPKTVGFGAGLFLLIVVYNFVSGLLSGVPAEQTVTYEASVYEIAAQIDQRESQLIERIVTTVNAGEVLTGSALTDMKNEINSLRDALPSISEIDGAVSIENRQLDQLDTILVNLSEQPVGEKQKEAINNAITIYNGLNINGEPPISLIE